MGEPTERVVVVERRLKLTPRRCAVCGQEFLGWGRARFCGLACQRRWDYQQHRDERRAKRRARYQAQKAAAADGTSTEE